ncbi:MAG TPA: hypothetical protein VNA68_02015, partial [Candidatus Dormibacteraeota bacterium]|nr:hypothetical protein [Candidatus Dormibacteraeota bacterium]
PVFALVGITAPLFLIPFTFKFAGGVIGSISKMSLGGAGKLQGKVKDSEWAKERQRAHKSLQLKSMDKLEGRLGRTRLGGDKLGARMARGGVMRGAGMLMGGAAAGRLQRDRTASGLVGEYSKALDDLQDATPGNLQNALVAFYHPEADERTKAMDKLKEAKATGLMGYTKTREGRTAIMRELADKNQLKSPQMNAIQAYSAANHVPDFEDALRESGKNMGKIPALLARNTDGSLNEGTVGGMVQSWTAGKIAGDDVALENFKVGSNIKGNPELARQFSDVFAKNASPSEVAKNFDSSSRSFMGADKRAEMLKMMARSAAFDSGSGLTVKNEVLKQIRGSEGGGVAKHQDALKLLEGGDLQKLGLDNDLFDLADAGSGGGSGGASRGGAQPSAPPPASSTHVAPREPISDDTARMVEDINRTDRE